MDTDPTVFVVDDDQGVREAVTLLMESIGLTAEGYASAQGYLDAFDPRRPGCLVLDVRMRGMSRLEPQERLALEPLPPPIVMVTGHGDVPMAVRAVQAGAVDFIEKPFKDQVLLDAVHRALQRDAQARGQAMRLGGDPGAVGAAHATRARDPRSDRRRAAQQGHSPGLRHQPVHGRGPPRQGHGEAGGPLPV